MRLQKRSLALALVVSFAVYLTPLVGPHMVTFLGTALANAVTSTPRETAWVAVDLATALLAQAVLAVAAAWALVRPRQRWPIAAVTFLALIFTLPYLYLVVIPTRFLIEPDIAPERHDWVERCVVPDTWLMAMRMPVTVTAHEMWWAQRSSARYAVLRAATCDAVDPPLPQPAVRPNGTVEFTLMPAFVIASGATLFERTETGPGTRTWWLWRDAGAPLARVAIDGHELLPVLSNSGDAVGWVEAVREAADAPAIYRMRVRSIDGSSEERAVLVPYPASMSVPVELDTAARTFSLWEDDRIVTLNFGGAIVGQSPPTAGLVRAQSQTYVRTGDGWLAWDAYRDNGPYVIAWSLAAGSGRHQERKGRTITSAAVDPSGRYVPVSASTALSIGHIRDTVYVLRADTGEEVYRRYLPMYVRSTVAFFDAGHFAYCDLAGTHILVLPK